MTISCSPATAGPVTPTSDDACGQAGVCGAGNGSEHPDSAERAAALQPEISTGAGPAVGFPPVDRQCACDDAHPAPVTPTDDSIDPEAEAAALAKLLATVRAKLALDGHELHELRSGAYLVTRAGLARHATDLKEVERWHRLRCAA